MSVDKCAQCGAYTTTSYFERDFAASAPHTEWEYDQYDAQRRPTWCSEECRAVSQPQ